MTVGFPGLAAMGVYDGVSLVRLAGVGLAGPSRRTMRSTGSPSFHAGRRVPFDT